jgi:hypothetical protein
LSPRTIATPSTRKSHHQSAFHFSPRINQPASVFINERATLFLNASESLFFNGT